MNNNNAELDSEELTARLTREADRLRGEIAALERMRAELSMHLGTHPGDRELQLALDNADAEIKLCERHTRRLGAAIAAAQRLERAHEPMAADTGSGAASIAPTAF